jgi:hypothetical protein
MFLNVARIVETENGSSLSLIISIKATIENVNSQLTIIIINVIYPYLNENLGFSVILLYVFLFTVNLSVKSNVLEYTSRAELKEMLLLKLAKSGFTAVYIS